VTATNPAAIPDAPARSGAPRNPLTAGGWSGLSFAIANVLGALVYYPLARRLEPEDFGLYAEANLVFFGLALLAEAALVQALVQARGDVERLAGAALWIGALLGLAGTVLCALSGPLMVAIYGDRTLVPLLLVMAPGVLAAGLGAVPHALLSRELDFRRKTLPESLSVGLGGAAALAAAMLGWGVYSLAVWSLARTVISTVTAWWVVRIRPRWSAPDREAARHIAASTAAIGGGDLALYARLNTDYALTGRILGTEKLGVYSLAWATSVGPLLVIQAFVGGVGFAVYSRLQQERGRLKRVFLSAIRLVSAVGMPVMLGAVIVAPDLVTVTLGAKWSAVVTPVMVLFVLQLIRAVAAQGASVMLAMGRTRLYALIGLAALPATIAAVVIGTQGGVTGVACAMLVAVGGVSLIYLAVALWLLRVPPRELVDALTVPALLTAATLPAVAATRALLLWGWDAPAVLRLAAAIGAGLLAFSAMARRLWPALRQDFVRVRRAIPEASEP
jgi:PST family polysaccharide transporter